MSYIILDNNQMWGRIKRNINEKQDVKGLTGITPKEIAKEIVYFNLASNAKSIEDITDVEELTNDSAVYILQKVSLQLADEGKLSFYSSDMLRDIKTCQEIYRIGREVRLGEIQSGDYSSNDRLSDFDIITKAYIAVLQNDKMYDDARFITEAVSLLEDDDFKESFLKARTENEKIKAFHLNEQSYMIHKLEELLDVERIEQDSLYTLEEPTINFYKAYGVENEIQYIVNMIKDNKIPYGDIAIYYTSNKYEGYIKSVLGREGINYSFVTGSKASDGYTDLFKRILDFASNDYKYKYYRNICRSKLMSNICWRVRLQRDSEVGWGRHTYLYLVNSKIEELNDEDNSMDEEKKKYYINYYNMMKSLLDIFEDDKTTLYDCYASIVDFLDEYSNKPNKERKVGLQSLRDGKQQISIISDQLGTIELSDALSILSDYMDNSSRRDSEAANSITVERMGNVSISDRTHSFFVGLSFSDFNSKANESPVMTDDEIRQYIKEPTLLASEYNQKREDAIKKTIDNMTGEVYLSYSYYDTHEILENSPSDIYYDYLEQEHLALKDVEPIRFTEIEGDTLIFEEVDYKERVVALQAKKKGEEELEEEEMSETIEENAKEEIETEELESEETTKTSSTSELKEVILSSTSIQTMINCPRNFQYHYEHYIPGDEEIEVSPKEWLSVNVKGTYIHEVLQKYFEKVTDKKDGSVEKSFDEDVFDSIIEETFNKYIKKYPYWNLDIADYRNQEYYLHIKQYLMNIHEDFEKNGWKVLCTEGDFEISEMLDSDVNSGIEDEDNKVKIKLTGFIDRVDYKEQGGKRIYRIVDYKSGKKDTQLKKVEARKLVQHEVYMRALEYISRNKIKIKSSNGVELTVPMGMFENAEYHFPMEEKEDDKIMVCSRDNELYEEMIKHIIDYCNEPILFTYNGLKKTARDEICKYCDYVDLCKMVEC